MPEIAVVTGAGSGLGRAIARRLGAAGFAVVATDIDHAAARETAGSIPGSRSAEHDVREAEQHRRIAREAAERGRVRVWVNSAGVLALGPAWTHPDAEIERCVETNVLGTMHGSRAAVEVMRDQPAGGSILNIASFAAFGAVPRLAVYAGSKHAVLGFTKSLNADLRNADSRIRATVACLDGTDTPMVRRHAGDPNAGVLWHRGRLLDPDDVAHRLVNALSSRRQVVCVPTARGLAAQLLGLTPALSLRLTNAAARRHRA
ncbi:SDR family oxidoreductase [Saccharopolyspora sp. NPDC049426]|uniref:SDR family NAD(P)-dependent oxidoreductase n=1 Tax=Saccharopolyspora sp. NPDC049426 TaxID=3155652 RepID=UPI0034163665